ncbi:hypothetical protein B0T09DRAFT_68520 [Sordaria sp. MPI-SDFR-AT-0083]|nr:hypothetical protein B0T09DRAFT_68520 [Sordaria sp. MPI-SDFR-AT-0083]
MSITARSRAVQFRLRFSHLSSLSEWSLSESLSLSSSCLTRFFATSSSSSPSRSAVDLLRLGSFASTPSATFSIIFPFASSSANPTVRLNCTTSALIKTFSSTSCRTVVSVSRILASSLISVVTANRGKECDNATMTLLLNEDRKMGKKKN